MKTRKLLLPIAIIFGLLVMAGGVFWYQTYGPAEFDRALWLQGESSAGNPRLRMAVGLVSSRSLLGKSKGEVVALLGPPATNDRFKDAGLVYRLDPERSWLTLKFDQAGHVNYTRIVSD